jgi:coproporphyrinogen III oxidase-like Fe-S oxidoreductase
MGIVKQVVVPRRTLWIGKLSAAFLRQYFRRRMRLRAGPCLPRPPPQSEASLLYVHVPFCEHLCPFCSFHRFRFDRERASRYFAALRDDIRAWQRRGYRFSEVYVGGGTPTVLPEELERTLALLRELFPLRSISVETNPNHLRDDILSLLERQGVDRLSVGVQSFDDNLLREMGRYRAYGSGAEMLERLRLAQGRFPTLNIDLLFNLPHQDIASLRRDLRIVTDELQVDQVSCYPLMSAPSTRRAMARTLGRPTPAREAAFYREILTWLRPLFTPASVWCFTRKTAALDEYIVDHREFAGAGSGTFSYLDGTLHASTFSLDHYLGLVGRGCSPLVAGMPLAPREQYRYALLMGLFGLTLDKGHLRAQYGEGILDALRWELFVLKRLDIVQEDADRFWLTERGMSCWLAMMREFFEGVNGLRERMRARGRSPAVSECRRDPDAETSSRGGGIAACCHGSEGR